MGRTKVDKRRPIRKVFVTMTCGHTVPFNIKIKPKPGEIIWCIRCADYKEVT